MTPLRKRMLEDMQLRNLTPETQRNYQHHITGLARFYMTSPDQIGLEEIRDYQVYLINERRQSPPAVNRFVSAAKFFYDVTLETPWPEGALVRARVPRKLPTILSPEEVDTNCLSTFVPRTLSIRFQPSLPSEMVESASRDADDQHVLWDFDQNVFQRSRASALSRPLW